MPIKQVIVMRKDLNMRKGKMIAQGSHASMGVLLKLMRGGVEFTDYSAPKFDYQLCLDLKKDTPLEKWISGQFKKITVSVNSEDELMNIYNQAVELNLPVSLITDAGHTEFNGVPTKTCLAIGPDLSEKIDIITGTLKLL